VDEWINALAGLQFRAFGTSARRSSSSAASCGSGVPLSEAARLIQPHFREHVSRGHQARR